MTQAVTDSRPMPTLHLRQPNPPLPLHCTCTPQTNVRSRKQRPHIVFSFQGAFNPPHIGHYESMKAFARHVARDYPRHNITMLFMPTAKSSKKKHLLPTQQYRIQHLDHFCKRLSLEFARRVQFQTQSVCWRASTVEYNINNKHQGSTDTIHTIRTLRHMHPSSTLLMGLGYDNCVNLLYWDGVEHFESAGLKAIYTVPRHEAAKRKAFYTHRGKKIPFRFSACVPHTLNKWSRVLKPKRKGDDTYVVAEDAGQCHEVTAKFHPALQCKLPVIRTARMKKVDISSSWLRKCIKEHTLSDGELLDKMVLDSRLDLLAKCKRFYRK